MSELKQKMQTRSKQPPSTGNIATPQKQQENTKSKSKSIPQKRPIQNNSLVSMGFIKQQPKIVPEPLQVLYTVKELLKHAKFTDILDNCPKVKSLYQLLCSKPFIKQKLVHMCLDKYFHGNTTSLWVNKYAPRSHDELYQSDFAEKIQQWIKDFYYFRKDVVYEVNDIDFIDDEPSQSYSKSLQIRMKQYGWNCKALVLKGRTGVGKTSLLTAIAKSMRIRCFQYASDVDQLQKMRELGDGAQSQCVNNYQIKKKEQQNNKIMRENSSIMKFMPSNPIKEELETKQPKRLQIFRNFFYYYPPSDKIDKESAQDSYFRCLFDSINKSPIPYVLTTDRLEFSFRQKSSKQKFSKFDVIEFVENTVEDLTYLYWTIYQIEHNLSLNYCRKIKKEGLYAQINDQLKQKNFQLVDILDLIRELVVACNKKPLYIAKYLQFKVLERQKLHLDTLESGQKTSSEFLEEAIQKVSYQIIQKINDEDLISNIEWVLYRKAEEDNPLEQTAAQEVEKSEKSIDKQIEEPVYKRPTLKQVKERLELSVREDHRVFQDSYFHFIEQKEERTDYLTQVPAKYHIQAKRNILKNIKHKIGSSNDQKEKKRAFIDIKQKQMFYLPLLFPTKRSSRSLRKQNNRQLLEQNLSKIMSCRQIAYMQKFAKFLYSSS